MAIPDEIPQGTIEFLEIEFDSLDDLETGTASIGLTSDPLSGPATWLPAGWVVGETNVARTTSAFDFSTISKGHYKIWGRVSDSPEVLPRPYGMVRVI